MPMGVYHYAHVCYIIVYVCIIYTAWVSALLIRQQGFSQDLNKRISNRRDPRFLYLIRIQKGHKQRSCRL